jgi:hypothetical protein
MADQATFTNITDVQVAPDTNATVIKEVAVWMDPAFTDGLFDSCKVRGVDHCLGRISGVALYCSSARCVEGICLH